MITRKYETLCSLCTTVCPTFANIKIGSNGCSNCKHFNSRDSDKHTVICHNLPRKCLANTNKRKKQVVDIDIPLTDDMLLMMDEIQDDVLELNEAIFWQEESIRWASKPHTAADKHGKLVLVDGDG